MQVLVANPGTEDERAVLTDFGMSFDLVRNQVQDYIIHLKYDGFRRGGAPVTLAPEVSLPRPGPESMLNYAKNDEWAVGLVAHELLSLPGCFAFENMGDPRKSRTSLPWLMKLQLTTAPVCRIFFGRGLQRCGACSLQWPCECCARAAPYRGPRSGGREGRLAEAR
jgi:hypothetical protein